MNIFNTSTSASFIILAVIVIRALFIHKLPKKTFTTLWCVVIFRLLMPFSIPSHLNIQNIIDAIGAMMRNEAMTSGIYQLSFVLDGASDVVPDRLVNLMTPDITKIAVDGGTNAAGAAASFSLPFWLWLFGLCACALYFLITHLRCHNMYKTALPVDNRFIDLWVSMHPLARTVRIRQFDKIDAPLTYGIFKPVILLPKTTDWHDEKKLSYILTHEYTHIRRFDTLMKWVLAGTLAIHWFNPLVWIMYVMTNRDIELSCDEAVVRECGENKKSAYALALIGLEESRSSITGLCSNFSKNAVEERVVSIMKIKEVSSASVFAAALVVSGITMVFATTSAVEYEKAPSSEYLERMLFVTKDDPDVKMTYDGRTWDYFDPVLDNEIWNWYSYEEYEELIKSINAERLSAEFGFVYPMSLNTVDKDPVKLEQTLQDIANGIKVSKYKPIYIMDGGDARWHMWYCFGYTVKDNLGNSVDLGLFETRDQLFESLKEYYDKGVMMGTFSQAEADALYSQIAHSIRNNDEVPLSEKINGANVLLTGKLRNDG